LFAVHRLQNLRQQRTLPSAVPWEPQIARKVERSGTIYEMSVVARDPGLSSPAPVASPADALGIPLLEPMVKVFAALADFEDAEKQVDRLSAALDRIAQGPAGALLVPGLIHKIEEGGSYFADPMVLDVRNRLAAAKPYCSRCPLCHQRQPGRGFPNCKMCGGRGWVTRHAFERAGEYERREIMKLRA
jgi:hypothetical protein